MTSSNSALVIWRYATLGGASVVVTRDEEAARDWYDRFSSQDRICFFQWQCRGCGADQSSDGYGHRGPFLGEETAQTRANQHAAECRAMAPVEDATPSTAAELVSVTTAVRELTAVLAVLVKAVDKAVDPVVEATRALPDIANAISDLPDHGAGLADVATAVESLAANLERPRPSWVRRFVRRRQAPAPEVAEATEAASVATGPVKPGDLIIVRQRLQVRVDGQFPDSYGVGEVVKVDQCGQPTTWRSAGSFVDTAIPVDVETIVIPQHQVDVAAAVRTAATNLFPGTTDVSRPYRSMQELRSALTPHLHTPTVAGALQTWGDRS